MMAVSRFDHYEPCPRCRGKGKDRHGDNLAVYTDDSLHCFSCGFHKSPPMRTLWEKDKDVEEKRKSGILPADYEEDAPAEYWKWLLQFGLPYSYWRPLIGHSKNHERMVFRVGEPLRFSLGRLFSKEGSLRTRKWHCWGDCHATVNPIGKGSHIVLVEDIISAHKVGQVTETIPLFGTNFPYAIISYLQEQNKPLVLWLDADQRDKVASMATNLGILTGCPVDIIITENDPKEVKYEEITTRLNSLTY